MRKESGLLVAAILGLAQCGWSAFMAGDVAFWAGQGDREAVVVIDWNSGPQPQSLAWGYRWEGQATAEDALRAVVAADDRLEWQVGQPSQWGLPLHGFSYDLNDNGIVGVGADESTVAGDAGDLHANGFLEAGFWALYLGGQGTVPLWESAMTGISGHTLVANGWIGLSFGAAPTWDGGAPDEPIAAAIPEPAAMLILLAGMGRLIRGRRS